MNLRSTALSLFLMMLVGSIHPAHAQERGAFEVVIKGSFAPQAGVALHFNESIRLRGLLFLVTNFEDLSGSTNVTLLFETSPGPLSTYLGPSFTAFGFTGSPLFLGGIFGSQYQLSERFGIFGEIGVDIAIARGEGAAMYNTGVGVVLGL